MHDLQRDIQVLERLVNVLQTRLVKSEAANQALSASLPMLVPKTETQEDYSLSLTTSRTPSLIESEPVIIDPTSCAPRTLDPQDDSPLFTPNTPPPFVQALQPSDDKTISDLTNFSYFDIPYDALAPSSSMELDIPLTSEEVCDSWTSNCNRECVTSPFYIGSNEGMVVTLLSEELRMAPDDGEAREANRNFYASLKRDAFFGTDNIKEQDWRSWREEPRAEKVTQW